MASGRAGVFHRGQPARGTHTTTPVHAAPCSTTSMQLLAPPQCMQHSWKAVFSSLPACTHPAPTPQVHAVTTRRTHLERQQLEGRLQLLACRDLAAQHAVGDPLCGKCVCGGGGARGAGGATACYCCCCCRCWGVCLACAPLACQGLPCRARAPALPSPAMHTKPALHLSPLWAHLGDHGAKGLCAIKRIHRASPGGAVPARHHHHRRHVAASEEGGA